MAKTICFTCRKVTDYTLHSRLTASREIGGKEIIFREKYATCNECGNGVAIARIIDENANEFGRIYNGLKGCGLL